MSPVSKRNGPATKIERYWLVTVTGLEEVAVDELREKLPAASDIRLERGGRHGRVFFTWRRSPSALRVLHAPLSSFALLADYAGITPGEPGKRRLIDNALKAPVEAGIRAWKAFGEGGAVGNGVRVRMQGRHRFAKEAVAAELGQILHERRGGQEEIQAPLVLQVDGRRALWGIQLGRSRRREVGGPGREIQGPVAFALGRILHLAADDLVVLYGGAVFGVDGIRQAVPQARVLAVWDGKGTRPSAGSSWPLRAGEDLPLLDCCSDAFVASIPQKEGVETAAAVLEEGARVLQPGGLGVYIADPRMLAGLIEALDLPLALVARLPLVLRGRQAVACLFERLEEIEAGPALVQIDP